MHMVDQACFVYLFSTNYSTLLDVRFCEMSEQGVHVFGHNFVCRSVLYQSVLR